MTARKLLVPSLLLLLAATPASAQLQGTLFTNPEQRDYLDFLREEHLARSRERGFDIDEVVIPDLPPEVAAPPPEPVIYRLGGIMSRQDGSHSIWLNGRSLDEDSLPGGATLVRENGTLALRFATPQGAVLLKPGQTLNFDAGRVQESYEEGSSIPPDVDAPPTEGNDQASREEPTRSGVSTEASTSTAGPSSLVAPEITESANAPVPVESTEQLEALATELGMNAIELQTLLQAWATSNAEATNVQE